MVIYDPNKLHIYGFTAEFTCTSVMSDPVALMIRYDNIPGRQYNDRSAYTTAERSRETLQWETG